MHIFNRSDYFSKIDLFQDCCRFSIIQLQMHGVCTMFCYKYRRRDGARTQNI